MPGSNSPSRSPSAWTVAGLLAGVGLAAWLASMGVGRIAAKYLALPEDAVLASLEGAEPLPVEEPQAGQGPPVPLPPPPLEGPVAEAPAVSKREFVDPILRRNIFDSANVGMATTAAEVGDSDRKSDLKVVLLATVVADPAEYSSALIAEEKGKTGALGYGIGDRLLDEAEIVRIEQRKVIIRRDDGTIEYIAMEEGKTYKKEGEGKAEGEGEGEDGIAKAGDNKFIVDQELVDQFLANPEKLYSKVRAVPHKGTDGEVDGYRLSGIRRNSVFSKLGIKNGDIVHTANGKPLTSMSGALDAFNSLQNDKNFSFEITRRGKRQTFEYEIR